MDYPFSPKLKGAEKEQSIRETEAFILKLADKHGITLAALYTIHPRRPHGQQDQPR